MVVRRVLFLMGLLVIAGCTTTAHRADVTAAQPEKAQAIAVGSVTARDEQLWSGYAVILRRALLAKLIALRGKADVVDAATDAVPPGAVLVGGELSELDKGNVALRWIIGFGAGRSLAVGKFRVTEPGGTTLLAFSTTKEYAGGAGIGGADLVDMDTLVRELGEKAAEAVDAWLRTGKLP